MKSWIEKENNKKDIKQVVEVPTKIMVSIIKLQDALCRYVKFLKPRANATAIYFFQRTYTGLKDTDPEIIFYIIASLHLVSKVFDDARLIQQFIDGLEDLRHNKVLLNELPSLSSFNNFDPESRQTIISKIIDAENNIIYRLDFQFRIPLPYDSATHVSESISHWHIPPDNEKTNENFSYQICNMAWAFLNGLLSSPLFYKYPHDMVGMVAVCLAFDIFNLPKTSITWTRWVNYLLPFYDISEVKQAYSFIKQNFRDYMVPQEFRINKPIEEIKERVTHFYITPLEDYREIDELCPPPPIELMEEIAGEKDSFNNLWSDHLPNVPPPPIELLSRLTPKPKESIPRRKYDSIQNDEDLIQIPQCGIALPSKPILTSDLSPANNTIMPSPARLSSEETFRSVNHTPQQQISDPQRRNNFYRYDQRDYDDQRSYDKGQNFFNYKDHGDYGKDRNRDWNRDWDRDRDNDWGRDRDWDRDKDRAWHQARPRSGMRSVRDGPHDQYRNQDFFESQDFQENLRNDEKQPKPPRPNYIPPPPPPPPPLTTKLYVNNPKNPSYQMQDISKEESQSPSSASQNSNQQYKSPSTNYGTSHSYSQDFNSNDRINNRDRSKDRRDHSQYDYGFRDQRGQYERNFSRRNQYDQNVGQYNRGRERSEDRNSDPMPYDRNGDFNVNRGRERRDQFQQYDNDFHQRDKNENRDRRMQPQYDRDHNQYDRRDSRRRNNSNY